MTKKFDVYIVNTKTRVIESIIGRGLSEDRAERRVMMGVSRTNIGPYCVITRPYNPDAKEGDKLK